MRAQGQSDVVAIDATDRDPRTAARLANAVANEYVAFRREADRSTILDALGPVDAQLRSLTPQERRGPQGQSLQDRAEQLRVFASLQTGSAEVVQPAGVPMTPSSPKTVRNVVVGLLLGVLFGVVVAVLAERLDPRLRDGREAEALLGRPPRSQTSPRAGISAVMRMSPTPHTGETSRRSERYASRCGSSTSGAMCAPS